MPEGQVKCAKKEKPDLGRYCQGRVEKLYDDGVGDGTRTHGLLGHNQVL